MIEVTLQLTEDELKELIDKQFTTIGRFDPDSAEVYKEWFHQMVDDGSGTLLYGPIRLRDWIMQAVDRTEVIEPGHEQYNEVSQLWDSGDKETNTYVVVCKVRQTFLIEYF